MSALHVVFKVAGAEYVIPASEVLQMESYTGATPVPRSEAWVAGIVQVRGRVIPVVDLRRRFGVDPVEPTLDHRLVVGQDGERAVALLVDSAREVLTIEEGQIEPPPSMVSAETRGFVRGVARVGSRLLLVIDFRKVIGEERTHGD